MKLWIKILSVFLFFSLIFLPKNIEARSGCCSHHGGVCGCGCCDGTSLSSTCAPYYPECGGGGYGTYSTYIAPPSCPLMSSYNSSTDKCECYSGYVASGNSCISIDQSCKNTYGYNSERDYSTDKCKCRYGYVWNSAGTKCISEDESCQNEFGYNSKATISGNQCECKYGYVWNSTQTKCIDDDQACRDKYGYNSKASYNGKCECSYGYMFNQTGTKCITNDAACQELNGPMSKSNLSGGCECLAGYEYDGSKCSYVKKEIVVDESNIPTLTPKLKKVTVEPTKIPTPTITTNETSLPDLQTSSSSSNKDNQVNSIGNFLSRIFGWLFK